MAIVLGIGFVMPAAAFAGVGSATTAQPMLVAIHVAMAAIMHVVAAPIRNPPVRYRDG